MKDIRKEHAAFFSAKVCEEGACAQLARTRCMRCEKPICAIHANEGDGFCRTCRGKCNAAD